MIAAAAPRPARVPRAACSGCGAPRAIERAGLPAGTRACAGCARDLLPGVRVLCRRFDVPRSAFADEGGPIPVARRSAGHLLNFPCAHVERVRRYVEARGPLPEDLLPASRAASRYALDEAAVGRLAVHGRLERVSERDAREAGAALHGGVEAALAAGRAARKRGRRGGGRGAPRKRVKRGANPLLALPGDVLAAILERVAGHPAALDAVSRVDRGLRKAALTDAGLWAKAASRTLDSPAAAALSGRRRVALASARAQDPCPACRRRVAGTRVYWEWGVRLCPGCYGERAFDAARLAAIGVGPEHDALRPLGRVQGLYLDRARLADALRGLVPDGVVDAIRVRGEGEPRPAPRFGGHAGRAAALQEALADARLPMRDDSRLCEAWIERRSDLGLDDVVNVMVEMHVLHEHLGYRRLLDRAFQEAEDDSDGDDGWMRRGPRVDAEEIKHLAYVCVGSRRPYRLAWAARRSRAHLADPGDPPAPGRWARAREAEETRYGGRARVYACLGLAALEDGKGPVVPLDPDVALYVERGVPIPTRSSVGGGGDPA